MCTQFFPLLPQWYFPGQILAPDATVLFQYSPVTLKLFSLRKLPKAVSSSRKCIRIQLTRRLCVLSLFSGVCLAVRLMNDLWAEWRASAVFSKHLSTPADWRSLCRVPDRFRSSWCRSGSNQMCLFKELSSKSSHIIPQTDVKH